MAWSKSICNLVVVKPFGSITKKKHLKEYMNCFYSELEVPNECGDYPKKRGKVCLKIQHVRNVDVRNNVYLIRAWEKLMA